MNKKGFTLAELLGVIVIISIILLLVMIPITKNIQKGTNVIFESQLKIIQLGTDNWISDNITSLPQKEGEKITITVGMLKQEGFLEMDLKNPTTGECIPNNTEITITKNQNSYEIYIDIDSGTDECPDIDNSSPIIYLNGEALMYVEYGSTWVDPGATAKTNKGVPITNINKVITGSGSSINTNGFNTYEITYSATDNGITVSAKRTVIIHDTTPPVLNVPNKTTIPSTQTTFNALEGVSATDNADGNISHKIKVIGSVSTGILGEYILTYEVEDNSGNKSTSTRKVTIQDKTAPTASATIQGNPYNSDGWAKANFQVKIKINDTGGSGPAGFKYCETTSTTCTPNTNVSKIIENITIDTQSSTNYICVIPYDHAGNDGVRQCFGPYKLDKTKPSTGITATAGQFNSDGWANKDINISITTSDTGSSNVKSYTYCTNSSSTCTPNTTKTGTSGTIIINTNGTTNYACAYSTDYAGNNSETVCTGPHKLDKSKPTISLTVNNNQFNGNGWAKTNINANVSTNSTGNASVASYTYCTTTSTSCTPNTKVNSNTGTITMSNESSTNYVCAYSTTTAGINSETSCIGPYKLDKSGPSISYPASTNIKQSAGSYNLKTDVSTSDNLTATNSITLNATGSLNFGTPGNYTITYVATDQAGNTTTKYRTVTIYDDIVPTLTITSSCAVPGENGWCRGNVTITLSSADNSSGISSKEYKVGNGSWNTLSGNTHTNTSDGTYTVYYRVKDGAGNYSETKQTTIYKDTVAPTCALQVTNCTEGYTYTAGTRYRYDSYETVDPVQGAKSGWCIGASNPKISFTNKGDASSYGISSSTSTTYNYATENYQTVDTAGTTWYGYVKDAAGNTNKCSTSAIKYEKAVTLTLDVSKSNNNSYNGNIMPNKTGILNYTSNYRGTGTNIPSSQYYARVCMGSSDVAWFTASGASISTSSLKEGNMQYRSIQKRDVPGTAQNYITKTYNYSTLTAGKSVYHYQDVYYSPAGNRSNVVTRYVEYFVDC